MGNPFILVIAFLNTIGTPSKHLPRILFTLGLAYTLSIKVVALMIIVTEFFRLLVYIVGLTSKGVAAAEAEWLGSEAANMMKEADLIETTAWTFGNREVGQLRRAREKGTVAPNSGGEYIWKKKDDAYRTEGEDANFLAGTVEEGKPRKCLERDD